MSRSDRVITLAALAMTLVFCGLLARVAQLQLAPDPRLAKYSDGRSGVVREGGVRGDLVDRRGRVLSTTRFGWRVFIDPTRIELPPDPTILALAKVISFPEAKIGEPLIKALAQNSVSLSHQQEDRVAAVPAWIRSVLAKVRPDHWAASEPVASGDESDDKVIKYIPIRHVFGDDVAANVRALKLKGVHLERASVREYSSGEAASSIVGFVGSDDNGLAGAEEKYNKTLAGHAGLMSYSRDKRGRAIWIDPADVHPSQPGDDAALAIDLEVQRIVMEELTRRVEELDAAGGRCIVLDTLTGEILAMADVVRQIPDAVPFPWQDKATKPSGREMPLPPTARGGKRIQIISPEMLTPAHPALRNNRCVVDVYEPGSTFKPFIWATVTELGLASPNELIDLHGGRDYVAPDGRLVDDENGVPQATWRDVLVRSSNIGMIKVGSRLTGKQMHDAVKRFGFGSRTPLNLSGEARGTVTRLTKGGWSRSTQTSVSFGYEVNVTPLQMARAFSVFARPGKLAGTLAPIRMTPPTNDDIEQQVVHRTMPVEIAVMTRDAMRQIGKNMEAKIALEHPDEKYWAYDIFGKSGTAKVAIGGAPKGKRLPSGMSNKGYLVNQYISSFIAGGPAEKPRLVVLTTIDDPGPEIVRARKYLGAYSAGPVVRRVMERTLTYLGVTPSVDVEALKAADRPAGAKELATIGQAATGQ